MDLADVLKSIGDLIHRVLLAPLILDSRFRLGFFYGVGLSFVLGSIGYYVTYWRGKIRLFFAATKLPATRDGPTPVGILGGCIGAIIKLAIAATLIFLFFVIVSAGGCSSL